MYHPFRGAAHFQPTKKKIMPNVADELAALRAKGSVKAHASNLTSSGGAVLSTPEAEEAALKAKRNTDRIDKLGKNEAKKILNKGSNAAASAVHAQAAQFTAKKKEDAEKKAQASEILKKGGTGTGYSPKSLASSSVSGKKTKDGGAKVAPQAFKTEDVKATKGKDKPKSAETTEEAKPAAATTSAVVDEVEDDVPAQTEDTEEIPDLETAADITHQTNEQQPSAEKNERQVTNRNEKKARKMMTRLGLRPVPGIARVTLKAGGNRGYFSIDKPDVYSSGIGEKNDTYVIFGEARQGQQPGLMGGGAGGAANNAAQAAQAQAAMAQAMAANKGVAEAMPSVAEEEDVPNLANVDAAAPASAGGDEDGVEAKDIELVMSQASCSRTKAVAALKENDGDLVNAIMSLTT